MSSRFNRLRHVRGASFAVAIFTMVVTASVSAFAQDIGALAAATNLTVRGAWLASVNYVLNDVVTSRGSTWRALKAGKGKVPGSTSPSSATYWEALTTGFNPVGAWTSAPTYQPNDIVTHLGSTWRAKITGKNKIPPSSTYWEQFAAKGAQGVTGATGAHGAAGPTGAHGAAGATGAAGVHGAAGATGATGAAGATGPAGADGSNGMPGLQGDPGAQGSQGPSGVVQTVVLSQAVNFIAGGSSDYVFVGNSPTVTLDGSQRLTGTASLPIFSSNANNFKQTLCYQASDELTPLVTFMGNFQSSSTIAGTYVMFTASASTVPPAGEYKVGYCVLNGNAGYFADWVQGWIMVTTEQ